MSFVDALAIEDHPARSDASNHVCVRVQFFEVFFDLPGIVYTRQFAVPCSTGVLIREIGAGDEVRIG